ncbi:MAG: hypothetical protein QGF09_14480, partial [Rhodospirillales bacterium]|nr:hypothetical protein [Rhodospirillales bacterium]
RPGGDDEAAAAASNFVLVASRLRETWTRTSCGVKLGRENKEVRGRVLNCEFCGCHIVVPGRA